MSLMIVRSRWRQYVCIQKSNALLSVHNLTKLQQSDLAYKTVRDHIVLLQYRRGHLSVHVIVVFDKRLIAHPRLFADEDGRFDDFAEACC